MKIEIGDKVVCIVQFENNPDYDNPDGLPNKDQIYVINGFTVDEIGNLGLKLIGLKSIHIASNIETGFAAEGFKKLDELKEENRQKYYESCPAPPIKLVFN